MPAETLLARRVAGFIAPMPEYTHTLIPERADYAPTPNQVAAFLTALSQRGAAPVKSTLAVSRLSGESYSCLNPFTGQSESWARRQQVAVGPIGAIPSAVAGLDDFIVIMSGKGPPQVRPLEFDFGGQYAFIVYCHLRPRTVSTSDWHDVSPVKRNVPFFGEPCSSGSTQGVFCHPSTLEPIEVPMAGCARFWIEFEFGKGLFPHIGNSLSLLNPLVVGMAVESFGVSFVQGCHWGA